MIILVGMETVVPLQAAGVIEQAWHETGAHLLPRTTDISGNITSNGRVITTLYVSFTLNPVIL